MNSTEERLKILEDERLIRALAASFADICTSGDVKRFTSLWTEDGAWLLSAPFTIESRGRDNNSKLFSTLAADKRFFCQMLHSGVVTISGKTATARWILSESASGHDGSFYQSLATYDDRLVYETGAWLFRERSCTFLNISQSSDHNLRIDHERS
ncbi:nuclear transport factor 2 family protein [Dyadobacter sp. CY356]|uniref:nuclear transport factor 2 family protein n=1 Tax=Dyadobacter sp. CY356 TaxID=2906442 RepID=UPI002885A726|nr:nuclear transport factor 2 family protein [Dyadobacter sp. CY356]